jgi:hypothetical protein
MAKGVLLYVHQTLIRKRSTRLEKHLNHLGTTETMSDSTCRRNDCWDRNFYTSLYQCQSRSTIDLRNSFQKPTKGRTKSLSLELLRALWVSLFARLGALFGGVARQATIIMIKETEFEVTCRPRFRQVSSTDWDLASSA